MQTDQVTHTTTTPAVVQTHAQSKHSEDVHAREAAFLNKESHTETQRGLKEDAAGFKDDSKAAKEFAKADKHGGTGIMAHHHEKKGAKYAGEAQAHHANSQESQAEVQHAQAALAAVPPHGAIQTVIHPATTNTTTYTTTTPL